MRDNSHKRPMQQQQSESSGGQKRGNTVSEAVQVGAAGKRCTAAAHQ
jgi:hypothetical protein